MKPLILVLFAQEYDELGLDPLIAGHDDYEFVREGFDFFTFPQNARILWFDVERFVDELAHKYRERRVAAVVSTHEQFGALAASLLTARLGLPSTPLKALLTAQHKFLARQIHSRALPDHVPPFCGFRYDADITRAVTIAYPIFVKPVKAAFSVLAKRCADEAALREHLRFRLWEKIIIKRLTWPFRRVSRKHLDCEIDADCFIAEGCVDDALQVCVDGYAHAGRVNILGTVDSVMYPGTSAFMRFEYPSRLDADVVARLEDIARSRRSASRTGCSTSNCSISPPVAASPSSRSIRAWRGSSRISTNASMARACGHSSSTSHWAGRRASRIAKAGLVRRPALCSASSAMP